MVHVWKEESVNVTTKLLETPAVLNALMASATMTVQSVSVLRPVTLVIHVIVSATTMETVTQMENVCAILMPWLLESSVMYLDVLVSQIVLVMEPVLRELVAPVKGAGRVSDVK